MATINNNKVMTDKVQKIREEVERMHNLLPVMDGDNISINYADRICNTLKMYIDSLQEEPVNKDFEMALAEMIDKAQKCVVEPLVIAEQWKNYLIELAKCEEPASEEFEEALAKEWQGYNDRGAATVDALEDNTQELAFAKGFYRGAKWQKEQMMKDAVDACVTEIRTYYKEENEIDFTVMYEKGIIPYDMEQEVKVIVIKED